MTLGFYNFSLRSKLQSKPEISEKKISKQTDMFGSSRSAGLGGIQQKKKYEGKMKWPSC